MPDFPLAVLADIHGNIWALDGVLADLARRGVRAMVNLGDSVYGPLAPADTADRLMRLGILSIRGNQDRILFDMPKSDDPAMLGFVRRALDPRHFDWLRTHAPTAEWGPDVLLCHGTPSSDDTYLLEEVRRTGVFLRDAASVAQMAGPPHAVLACGHSHIPRTVSLADGRLALNPGSVGLPAYGDALPFPHAMENGSPHARYAILDRAGDAWCVEHIAAAYRWDLAAEAADRNGRPDWGHALRTGRAAGLPAGVFSSIPILPVRNLDAAIPFYGKLGFALASRYGNDYAIVARDGTEIHMRTAPKIDPRKNECGMYVRIADADALYQECQRNGVPCLTPPEDKYWRQREFAVSDPDGNLLRFGRQLG